MQLRCRFCVDSFSFKRSNSATGHFVWLVRLPGTVSNCTFVPHIHYQRFKTCSRHIFSHVPTLLNNFFAEYEQRPLYSALVVTVALLLLLINCRFIIIISSSSNIQTCHRLVCNISLNNQTCPFAYLSVRWNLTLSKRGGPFPSPSLYPSPPLKPAGV